jgi:cyclophilin family peptidyl-prolyl cis-trans isomerase
MRGDHSAHIFRAGARRAAAAGGGGRRVRRVVGICGGLGLLLALACGEPGSPASTGPARRFGPVPEASAPRDVAVLEVSGFGAIRIELLGDLAPATVAQFERLAESGFYDGTTFHRVIPGFMIQGGDPKSRNRDPRDDGTGVADAMLPDEHSGVSHVRGIVSMANRGRPGTGSCQFFITVADVKRLDGGYTAFGRVVEGMDVVDRIVRVPRDEYGRHGPPDRPLENVVIASVRIERAAPAASPASPSGL